ncbi:MAG: hypothetical protein AB7I42_08500 [Bradyrhizobium sp.]|uniref:hypothetical protein n=1 Tax=Hyphomicrobiales TaxID=356 RepID=UPI00124EC398|nr:hypothetical protein [Brucella anthropi]KAB2770258.1 hypothetical protein F9K84_05795 [Brucella anthropi]
MDRTAVASSADELDTIVVPAHPKGFNEVFVKEHRWPNVKIDRRRIENVKYIAVYQTGPVSAITHYAEIASFEALKQTGRYDLFLKGGPIAVDPVPYTAADVCAVQGPRYTKLKLVLSARHLTRAFP